MKFGEYLLEKRLVENEAVQEVLSLQRYQKRKLGRLLVELQCLDMSNLNQALLNYQSRDAVPSVKEILNQAIKSSEVGAVSEWASGNGMDAGFLADSGVTLIGRNFRDEILEAAEEKFKVPCRTVIYTLEEVQFIRSELGLVHSSEVGKLHLEVGKSDDQKIGEKEPYIQLFRDCVVAAKKMNASDIHIQPSMSGLDIRFRVNGELEPWRSLGVEHRRPFVNEVKRITNLSIAKRGKAQDGRVALKALNLDLRVSLLPSQYDEKIVLRLLDGKRSFEIDQIGFDEETFADLKNALRFKNGLILMSGPTGSGKTTTLYTLLCAVDRKTKNVITLEDPIEYAIEGLTQVQVNQKLSFNEALRSVLRQDPDVILVGEIRDGETADLCVKAASTGHLVLSTLHANGAYEVVKRLKNLGVDPYMLRSVLRFSAAQRLIRSVCKDCCLKVEISESPGDFVRGNPSGCEKCRSGFTGRMPILEYLKSSHIAEHLEGSKTVPLNWHSLRSRAGKLAEKGLVDFYEAMEME